MADFCPLHTEVQHTLTEHATQLGYVDAKIQALCDKHDSLMDKLDTLHKDYQESKMLLMETNMLVRKMNGNTSQVVTTTTISQQAEQENKVPGFAGALNRGWNKFRDNLAFYIIIGAIALVGWYLFNLGLIKLGLRVVF